MLEEEEEDEEKEEEKEKGWTDRNRCIFDGVGYDRVRAKAVQAELRKRKWRVPVLGPLFPMSFRDESIKERKKERKKKKKRKRKGKRKKEKEKRKREKEREKGRKKEEGEKNQV